MGLNPYLDLMARRAPQIAEYNLGIMTSIITLAVFVPNSIFLYYCLNCVSGNFGFRENRKSRLEDNLRRID